jgi:hypothetical protein
MKTIELTQGFVAKVDDEDFHWLDRFSWCANEFQPGFWYATSGLLIMHRLVMGISTKTIWIDHKNRDTLDNQKFNLRIATPSQNQQNANIRTDNTTGYKGVSRRYGDFMARISVEGKRIYLGTFSNAEDAARAYDAAAVEHFGEFARVNFVDGEVSWDYDR